jgi:hypothetical protein
MQRHLVRPLILGLAAAFLVAVGPAAAKIPFFSVEVSPPDPTDGDVVLVTVLMWEDASHTQPATWSPGPEIAGLLEFRSDAGRVPITLHRLGDATYRAEVTLAAGTWRLVAFPLGVARTDVPGEGYATPVRVTVSERWDPSAGAVMAVAGALGTVGLLVGRQLRRGMRHRRLRSATG